MTKIIMTLLIIIVLVLAGVLLVKEDPGFLMIQYQDYSLETTLAFGVVVLAIAAVVINFVVKILLLFIRTPSLLSGFQKHRKIEKSRLMLNKGLIDLAEARFEQAEKKLTSYIEYSENPLLNYLTAARAAHQQGKFDKRDEYLKQAYEASPEAKVAIGVTQGELQLAAKQTERAFATVQNLYESTPRHGYILKLLTKTFLATEQWEEIRRILPDLKKKKLFIDSKYEEIVEMTYLGCLRDMQIFDEKSMDNIYAEIKKQSPDNINLVLAYLDKLETLSNAYPQIEKTIREVLKVKWEKPLVVRYGKLDHPQPAEAFTAAEKWLIDHSHDADLLLTLGRLARKAQIWGKAQQFLESGLEIDPSAELYMELAQHYSEDLKQPEKANQLYHEGLQLCVQSCR